MTDFERHIKRNNYIGAADGVYTFSFAARYILSEIKWIREGARVGSNIVNPMAYAIFK